MSHEGGGMKLRDLARSSSNSTSFLPAFHILRSRFKNREASRLLHKPYESVPTSSPILPSLTLVQQTTMIPIPSILRRPRHPGSPITFPVRTYHRDRNFRQCMCYRPISLRFLTFEQSQSYAYREVLIAGDLSQEDLEATNRLWENAVSRL